MNAPVGTDVEPLLACLDADTMRGVLNHALPDCADGVMTVETVSVAQARRNASRHRQPHPLSLVYEVALRGNADQPLDHRRYYGKVYRGGASARDTVPGTLHLAALDMRLWPWPLDPGLPQLSGLLQPSATRAWWGRDAHDVQALRHEPEDRALLRYRGADVRGDARELYAKTFSDGRGADIHQRVLHFWREAQVNALAPTVAEPLGYEAATHTLWLAPVQGVPLVDTLGLDRVGELPGGERYRIAARLAVTLATVHEAPPALAAGRVRDVAHWLREIARRARKVSRAVPQLAARAEALGRVIERQAHQLPPIEPALIHGDCHPEQVWLQQDRVVLFDFDECALGDPMEDLAQFITRLGGRAQGARLATELLAAYAQVAPQHFRQARLRWHLAVQQLLQASRAFVYQGEGWRIRLAGHLARAESLLQSHHLEPLA